MTLQAAQSSLVKAMSALWSSVGELTIIVVEDQPAPEGLAAAESLVEQVSDLQGDVAAAVQLLGEPQSFPLRLGAVAEHVAQARLRYWRDLRAVEPVVARRRAARRAGGKWPAWLRIVEQSARRCEQPMVAVDDAVNACWLETTQLFTRTEGQPALAITLNQPDNTRRMS